MESFIPLFITLTPFLPSPPRPQGFDPLEAGEGRVTFPQGSLLSPNPDRRVLSLFSSLQPPSSPVDNFESCCVTPPCPLTRTLSIFSTVLPTVLLRVWSPVACASRTTNSPLWSRRFVDVIADVLLLALRVRRGSNGLPWNSVMCMWLRDSVSGHEHSIVAL
ncbi:hypothetical protein RHMOL_Rhmol04G0213000 [Rhododendron molle]|uniref:Uncharacterized protein n=1 Tax=Rhododendron molle TaxID=49168 RepID=A0ACC0P4F3_RHOML|nr:hypothetical protein RHMOL_Rhmol04G0213000 [Rhododendron molle]